MDPGLYPEAERPDGTLVPVAGMLEPVRVGNVLYAAVHLSERERSPRRSRTRTGGAIARHSVDGGSSAQNSSARPFAPYQMKDATELAVWVSSARLELDRSRRRHLL